MNTERRLGVVGICLFAMWLMLGLGHAEARAQNNEPFFETRDLTDFTGTMTLIDRCYYNLSLERSGGSIMIYENGKIAGGATFKRFDDGNAITSWSYSFRRATIDDSNPSAVKVTIGWTESYRYVNSRGESIGSSNYGDFVLTFDSTVACRVPEIVTGPVDLIVENGSSAVFRVSSTGTGLIRYQWYKNGNSISGATGSRFEISKVDTSDAGQYTVRVSNLTGNVQSPPAQLIVQFPPEIVTGPVPQTVDIGSAVAFEVTAGGTGPLTYQWYKDGDVISGATGSRFEISETGAADTGVYVVRVSNSVGSVDSFPVSLNVNPLQTGRTNLNIQRTDGMVLITVNNLLPSEPVELWRSTDLSHWELDREPFTVPEESFTFEVPISSSEAYFRVVQNGGTIQPGFTISGVGIEMVGIEPGTFIMGSPSNESGRSDDENQHEVTLTQGYWLGKYEVTQGQWESLMGSNPSEFKNAGKNAPVETVSWEDTQEFIKKLNARERAAGRLPEGYVYGLPTEAQWEYACRAGTSSRYYFGNDEGQLGDYAWYNSGSVTHPVGQKQPNAWGLYDMSGNVYEWCEDWYGHYPTGPVTNPVGPASGSNRVLRGGSWIYYAKDCRSADRGRNTPSDRFNDLGFRLSLRSASVR